MPDVARCPTCRSTRIVIVVSPQRRAFCTACGTRWVQVGSEQRSIERTGEADPVTEASRA